MIVSHHGELEFGSPKVPLFPEAMLLHHLDNLDSKMNAMSSVFRREQLSVGEFTGWVPSLERVLLRKDRYLSDKVNGSSAASPTPPAASPAPASVREQPAASNSVDPPEPAAAAVPHEAAPATPQPIDPRPVPPPSVPKQPAIPGVPAGPSAAERKPEPHRPQTNTLFGEKLQAVLGGRK